MSVSEIVEKALKENPDIRLALEAVNRARDAESKEVPREVGMATEVVAIPLNPQCPVSLVTLQ
jgi:predicted DNA-binding protein